MSIFGYTLGVIGLCAILVVFSFLDRIYRQLGRVATGPLRDHCEIFESEIAPRFKLDRRRASLGFAILANLFLVAVAVEPARGVLVFVPAAWEAAAQLTVYVIVEVLFCVHFAPEVLMARTNTRWLGPLVPAFRAALLVIWPLRAVLELAISVAHISEDEIPEGTQAQQDGIEALMEAAQEGGILAGDKAQWIEQVVEFSDKRVLEVMTPRPDIVAIPADATVEQMKRLLVETKFSRVVVYQQTLDDVLGVAHVQDVLQIPESDAKHRTVRELQQVLHPNHRADVMKVFEPDLLRRFVELRRDRDVTLDAAQVLEQLQRALAADRQRDEDAREDHRRLQRQHRQA